jgi:hypothetical protein
MKASWMPQIDLPGIPPEQVESATQSLLISIHLGVSAGVLHVSDEWNRLLPDFRFTSAEEFLTKVWRDKP